MSSFAFVGDRKATNGDAVDRLDARRAFVTPGDVVFRAGGDDLDVRVPGESFGDVASVKFSPSVDVRAVTLDSNR